MTEEYKYVELPIRYHCCHRGEGWGAGFCFDEDLSKVSRKCGLVFSDYFACRTRDSTSQSTAVKYLRMEALEDTSASSTNRWINHEKLHDYFCPSTAKEEVCMC